MLELLDITHGQLWVSKAMKGLDLGWPRDRRIEEFVLRLAGEQMGMAHLQYVFSNIRSKLVP